MRGKLALVNNRWCFGGIVVLGLLVGGGYKLMHGSSANTAQEEHQLVARASHQKVVAVKVTHPRVGAMDRTTTQPSSVLAYESVPLQSAVSGYLKKLNVDIGSKVKKGEVLAVIEVPELVKQLQHQEAVVKQTMATVAQMRARKDAAKADLNAAKAAVKQAKAAVESAKATLRYRETQFKRYSELAASHTVEDRVKDEAQERFEAAAEAERAAEETIVACESRVEAVSAKIIQADADIEAALANVDVAKADVEKTQELLNYATIKAPFDGVITKRNVFERYFIRAASAGTMPTPLLTIDRTDKMRVVVQIPDRDAPFCDPGDEATIEIVTLPGQKFKSLIARVSNSEDSQTRMMQVEIDLPNPDGKLWQGMYGYATITLEKSANVLALPPSSIVNKQGNDKGQVYVVRSGRAYLTPVTIVANNGVDLGVLGLKATDEVVISPTNLADGMQVTISQQP
jgi:RND family efflux transporter MFP subunit